MSITINGTAYLGDYVNISADFTEQPGAVLKIDPWGMDSITRRFNGKLSHVETELDKLEAKRNYRDAFYTHMHAVDWSVTHDAPFPTLEIAFKGIRGGKPRDPEIKTGLRKQSVTVEYTGATVGETTGASTTLTYYAPYATAQYTVNKRPKAAKYRTLVPLDGDAFHVVSMTGDSTKELHFMRGSTLNGARSSGTVLSGIANAFNVVVEISTTTFDVVQVGQWFNVTETNEAILVQRGLTPNKRQIRA